MTANIMFDHLGRKRKDRVFRERFEINTMTDEEIRKRYRFGKESIEIIQLVEHNIKPNVNVLRILIHVSLLSSYNGHGKNI